MPRGVMAFGTGWYYGSYVYDDVYWPYGYTYGAGTWYNEHTGTYGRSVVGYGPYGRAGRAAALQSDDTGPTRGVLRRTASTSARAWAEACNPRTGTYRVAARKAATSTDAGGRPRWCVATTGSTRRGPAAARGARRLSARRAAAAPPWRRGRQQRVRRQGRPGLPADRRSGWQRVRRRRVERRRRLARRFEHRAEPEPRRRGRGPPAPPGRAESQAWREQRRQRGDLRRGEGGGMRGGGEWPRRRPPLRVLDAIGQWLILGVSQPGAAVVVRPVRSVTHRARSRAARGPGDAAGGPLSQHGDAVAARSEVKVAAHSIAPPRSATRRRDGRERP